MKVRLIKAVGGKGKAFHVHAGSEGEVVKVGNGVVYARFGEAITLQLTPQEVTILGSSKIWTKVIKALGAMSRYTTLSADRESVLRIFDRNYFLAKFYVENCKATTSVRYTHDMHFYSVLECFGDVFQNDPDYMPDWMKD